MDYLTHHKEKYGTCEQKQHSSMTKYIIFPVVISNMKSFIRVHEFKDSLQHENNIYMF